MKKFIPLVVVALVGLTTAGCMSSSNQDMHTMDKPAMSSTTMTEKPMAASTHAMTDKTMKKTGM